MCFDWDGLPSNEVGVDAVRTRLLQQGEANDSHPEGSRHL